MKRKFWVSVLLTALAMTASAQENSPNAVCVSLKSGEQKFVLFSDRPLITTNSAHELVVSSAQEGELNLGGVALVDKITATYYDSTLNGIGRIESEGKTQNVEIYDLDGVRVLTPQKGKIYIIKTGGKAKKQIIK